MYINDSLQKDSKILSERSSMFRRVKMRVTTGFGIFSIALLLLIGYSSARPHNENPECVSKTGFSKEFEDLSIEDNILKGIVKPLDDRKFGQVIYDALKESPEHVGQIDAQTGKQTTYREMMDRSIRLASWMNKQGVSPDDTIVVCTHNQLDSYLPVFATFFVDAVFTGWSEEFTLYTLRHYTTLLEPKLIFTNEKAADKILEALRLENSTSKLIVFGKHSNLTSLDDVINEQTQDDIDNFELVNLKSPQDVATIILSSGSSGNPKGTMLGNKLQLPLHPHHVSPNKTVRYMWYSTLEWISGLLLTFSTIETRGTRIIPASNDSTDDFYQNIEKYKVNYVLIPLSVLNDIAKSGLPKNYDLQSLKTILTAGSKVSKDILLKAKRQLPNAFVGQGYGMTEAAGIITYTTSRSKHVEAAGIVVPNCQVKIVDTTSGETLGPNKNGELYIKSPAMMIGYYKNPNETKQAFDAEGWYMSKDLGYYDEEGEIFIVDRIKEIMKYKNHQISPLEIEDILISHRNVQEVAVAPSPVGVDGDRPVAFIKKAPGSSVTKDELMKLTSVLEDYKQLLEIYFVDKIPHLPSGKLARAELREMAKELAANKNKS